MYCEKIFLLGKTVYIVTLLPMQKPFLKVSDIVPSGRRQ